MRFIQCLPDILVTASLSVNPRKLSPNQPVIVFAPPYPGPPLFVALKSRVLLFLACARVLDVQKGKAKKNMKACRFLILFDLCNCS